MCLHVFNLMQKKPFHIYSLELDILPNVCLFSLLSVPSTLPTQGLKAPRIDLSRLKHPNRVAPGKRRLGSSGAPQKTLSNNANFSTSPKRSKKPAKCATIIANTSLATRNSNISNSQAFLCFQPLLEDFQGLVGTSELRQGRHGRHRHVERRRGAQGGIGAGSHGGVAGAGDDGTLEDGIGGEMLDVTVSRLTGIHQVKL